MLYLNHRVLNFVGTLMKLSQDSMVFQENRISFSSPPIGQEDLLHAAKRLVSLSYLVTSFHLLSQGAVCPSSKESTDNLDEEQEDIDGSDSSIHELLTPEPPPGIEVTNLLSMS